MTYEFNAGDTATNDIPSPFRIENLFLYVTASIYAICGAFVIMQARAYVASKEDTPAILSAILAIGIFAVAVKITMRALTQMRFFLGRDFPVGLAGQIKATERGEGKGAAVLQEQMRSQAVAFEEPTGVFSGVLYSLIKPLNTAPSMVQYEAVRHFHTMISMLLVLGSLAVSYMLFSGTKHEGIVSWAYLPLTGLSLLTPFMQDDDHKTPPDSTAMLWRIVALGAFAVAGPVLVQRFVPALNIPPMWFAPLALLIGSIVATGLFLASLFSHIDNITQTSVSCEQTTIDMNCPPAQLWGELGREFQNNWTSGIPNRKYVDLPPDVADGNRGSFNGHLVEETHPVLAGEPFGRRMKDALAVPYGRYLVALLVWGLLLAVAAAVMAPIYARALPDMARMEISRSFLTIIALTTASVLSFRIGHLLWARMYFKSRLVWVDVSGTFQTSELEVGNQMTGHVRSKSALTRIEDATLRVWVTDIVSVAFGKEGDRFILEMAPADGHAKVVTERLKQFAAMQSMLVAPTSERDVQKVGALKKLDHLMGAPLPLDAAPRAALEGKRKQVARLPHLPDGGVIGHVKFFDPAKGFGFLRGEDGVERFFGASQLKEVRAIPANQRVRFVEGMSKRGPTANHVEIL